MRAGAIVRAWRAIKVGGWPLKLDVRERMPLISAQPVAPPSQSGDGAALPSGISANRVPAGFASHPSAFTAAHAGLSSRRAFLPLGRWALSAMIAWGLIANLALWTQGPAVHLGHLRGFAIIIWLPLCIVLTVVVALWGTRYIVAGTTADEVATLSNQRLERP